jgi:hypothetical protein
LTALPLAGMSSHTSRRPRHRYTVPARPVERPQTELVTTRSILTRVREPNRWCLLALLGIAQLMVTLDVTIVNIALPTAQKALHFNTDVRQRAITACALWFGSLLSLGIKLGDLFGHK